MGYNSDDSMVRVDFFKESGRWYSSEDMKWDRYSVIDERGDIELINDTFKRCLDKTFGKDAYEGMIAICLEPYHEHAFPLMIRRIK